MAYQLDLPSTSQIHLVFHVSQLKPIVGSKLAPEIVKLLDYYDVSQNFSPPLAILNKWTILVDNQFKYQVLVQWDGLPAEKISWEDVDILQDIFSHLN